MARYAALAHARLTLKSFLSSRSSNIYPSPSTLLYIHTTAEGTAVGRGKKSHYYCSCTYHTKAYHTGPTPTTRRASCFLSVEDEDQP